MKYHLILLALCALLPATLCSQSKQRVVAGTVLDANGAGVARAKIVLQAGPSPAHEEGDRIEAESDERGRFRARVLRGTRYAAWAEWLEGEARVFSTVLADVGSARRLTLRQATSTPISVRIECIGLDLWKAHELPLKLVVVEPGERRRELKLSPEGRTELDAMPGDRATIEILRGGSVLHTTPIALTKNGRKAVRARLAKEQKSVTGKPVTGLPELSDRPIPGIEDARIVVPPPLVMPIHVVDASTGKSITGAELQPSKWGYSASYDPRAEHEKTDANGRAEVPMALSVDSWGRSRTPSRVVSVHILADGYKMALAGWEISTPGVSALQSLKPEELEKAIAERRLPLLSAKLTPTRSVELRIVGPDGQAQAGLPILARLRGRAAARKGISVSFTNDELLHSNKLGLLALRGVAPEHMPNLELAVILPSSLASSESNTRVTVLSGLTVILPSSLASSESASEIPTMRWLEFPPSSSQSTELDLRKLSFVELQVMRSDRGPASNTQVTLSGPRNAFVESPPNGFPYSMRSVETDRRGRCLLPRLIDGGKLNLICTNSEEYFIGELEKAVPRDKRASKRKAYELAMRPMTIVRGRVVDLDGKPVPGATIYQSSVTSTNATRTDRFANRFNQAAIRATSDRKGNFELRYISIPSHGYGVQAYVTLGENTLQSANSVDIPKTSGDFEIEVNGRLPPPAKTPAKRLDEKRGSKN